ncbi:MAG: dienelactone hydrolase family protein [Woeseiaceae bacterium]|jgi:dienelactone hydrolase|nr:dienelactone hydrolase family protein [Woeseiaceae bacterium]
MSIRTRHIDYSDGDVALQGCLAWDDAATNPRPGILVSHAWSGRSPFEDAKAEALAELGYVSFALDVYGKGVRGSSVEENAALLQPFLDDRMMLRQRLLAALDVLREQPEVDATKCGAIGFCFGGLCALDLARSGADLAGVVSFHGLFHPPPAGSNSAITARVLALHGWDDPMVPPAQVEALADELTTAGADWQLHAYGNTMHAFTNPQADDRDRGTVYAATADRRSWIAMKNFFAEVFGV